jgi:glycosyltransferase involved in cell wall biosynthesis
MEQALGHATHYENFRRGIEHDPGLTAEWLPIPFAAAGLERFVPALRSNWSIRASWRARRALAAARRRGPLDVVFFHTQVTSLFSVGTMHETPSVISMDATPINYDSLGEFYGHHQAPNTFLERQKYKLNRRAYQAAAGLVTWSNWAKRSLVDDYGVDSACVRVIPPGASSTYFQVGARRVRTIGADATSPTRILFVGGDFARKGGQLLIDLMRSPVGLQCQLDIVSNVESPAMPNVSVHRGLTANSGALQDLFARADLFALPTYADCLGIVVEEAAASGLPSIVTNVGGVPESVVDGESGIVIPTGDAAALQQAVVALVGDPSRRHQMGRAAHRLATTRFNADENNHAIVDFLKETTAASKLRTPKSITIVPHHVGLVEP